MCPAAQPLPSQLKTAPLLANHSADFGWFDSGWHAESGDGDDEIARTPNMDKLVQSGMELDRNYAVRASPTRAVDAASSVFATAAGADRRRC